MDMGRGMRLISGSGDGFEHRKIDVLDRGWNGMGLSAVRLCRCPCWISRKETGGSMWLIALDREFMYVVCVWICTSRIISRLNYQISRR